MADIDAPEKRQPYGTKAKKALANLTFNKLAKVVEVDRDRYGRLVGRVYVNGLDVNAELVRKGYAWVYRKYAQDPELLRLEYDARNSHKGIWSSNGSIPPWEWRKGRRTLKVEPKVVRGMIVANKRSKVYHLPGCPSYGEVSSKNRVLFSNRETVEAEGYRLAGNCR